MKTVHAETTQINQLLKNKRTAWLLIAVSVLLMIIDTLLKMPVLIGGWHIVLYVALLIPLLYLLFRRELVNRYTKWFLPFLAVMIADMFIYNNNMVQFALPAIFYITVMLLYLSAMQEVHTLYQTLVPGFAKPVFTLKYIKEFLNNFRIKKVNKRFYIRIGTALLITLPFLGIFLLLLSSADTHYSQFMKQLFTFRIDWEVHYLISMPLYFAAYLAFFIYGFSNYKVRTDIKNTKNLDLLIVNIFLGAINLLFFSFVALQIPFLLNSYYLPSTVNIAEFAREGFFQLMIVMGIVMLIFLFILRRFKGEKLILFFLTGLLLQTILMGIVSLKKMHLYQDIKGATVLRYYVEWFDYFLIFALLLGILFLVRKYPFAKLLNIITVSGLMSFTIIVSLNIDAIVAKHNIEKFRTTPDKLDKKALRNLSIDALPVIEQYHIALQDKNDYNVTHKRVYPWYIEPRREDCNSFKTYHYGYCSTLKKYGK
jgi:hypothetical protein